MSGRFIFADVESGGPTEVEVDAKPLACRGCLAASRPLRPLECGLAAIYGELVPTNVSPTDILPKFVCSYCRALLLKFKAFREKCLSVQTTYLQIVNSGIPITQDVIKSNASLIYPPYPDLQTTIVQHSSYLPLPSTIEDVSEYQLIKIETVNQLESNDELNKPTSSFFVTPDDLKSAEPDISDDDYNESIHDSDSHDENDIPIADIQKLLVQTRKPQKHPKSQNKRSGNSLRKKSKFKEKGTQKKIVSQKIRFSPKQISKKHSDKSNTHIRETEQDTNKSKLDIYFERRRANSEKKFNVKYVYLSKEEQIKQVESRKTSVNYKLAIYKCDFCYRGYRMELAYKNHMSLHDPSRGDELCDICRMRFPTKKELTHHQYLTHRYDLVCNECGHVTKTSCNAAIHYRKHRGVKYPCKVCGKFFDKPNRVFDHMNIAHEGALACAVCDEKFNGPNGLRVHMFRAHKEAEGAVCDSCNVQFHSHAALQRHRPNAQGCDRALKPCVVCGDHFPTDDLLQLHKREQHHAKKGFSCTVCGKILHSKIKYRNHVNNHITQNKTKWFDEGGSEPDGRRQDRASQVFVCEICGFGVKNSIQALEKHRRTHTGEKLFQCEICQKRFTTKRYLGIHTGKHMGIKPPTKTYLCRFCDKPFNHQGNRDKHEKGVHQKLRPFQCEICDKNFQSKDAMQNHVNHTHQGVPWPKRFRKRDSTFSKVHINVA